MTIVYFVRHGESEWNQHNKVQGKKDIELSPKGLEQAMLLAKRLKGEKIDCIYTSTLKRAKRTAEVISNELGIDLIEVDKYQEIGLGPWEGLTVDEIKLQYAEHYKTYKEEPVKFMLPGAETILEVADRLYFGIKELIKLHEGKKIIIVSHATAIKAAIIKILDIDINKYNRFRIDNASLTVLTFNDDYIGGVVVNTINDTCHLKPISSESI